MSELVRALSVHGAAMPARRRGCRPGPTPSTRRRVSGAHRSIRPQVALTLHAAPKREDHLASTDDPIEECIAVLANGEEPDEDMLAKCREIAVEEFANQATLEDENSY